MKIAILGIQSSLYNNTNQNEVIDYIKNNLAKQGKETSLVSYFSNDFNLLNSTMQSNYDAIFLIGSDSAIYNNNIKESLAKILGVKLEKNLLCENNIIAYCNDKNIEYSMQEELLSIFPINAKIIYDNNYLDNGFYYRFNQTDLFVLPPNIDFVSLVFKSEILPYFDTNCNNNDNKLIIKCYGMLEKDITELLNNELNVPQIDLSIFGCRLDNTINIKYSQSNANIAQTFIADICSKLSKLIYSTEDMSLYETATNLLELQSKKIVIAETITNGQLAYNLMKLNKNSVEKSITTSSFDSIAKQLKLNERIVNQFGKYSVNTIYELDNLLLQQSSADIAVFILADTQLDCCYISIGDIEGIHVYKNKVKSYNKTNIDMICDTALFYLIKKLRQKDLQFI